MKVYQALLLISLFIHSSCQSSNSAESPNVAEYDPFEIIEPKEQKYEWLLFGEIKPRAGF